MASAYDFDATAIDVFATTNPSIVSQMFNDWTSKQFEIEFWPALSTHALAPSEEWEEIVPF